MQANQEIYNKQTSSSLGFRQRLLRIDVMFCWLLCCALRERWERERGRGKADFALKLYGNPSSWCSWMVFSSKHSQLPLLGIPLLIVKIASSWWRQDPSCFCRSLLCQGDVCEHFWIWSKATKCISGRQGHEEKIWKKRSQQREDVLPHAEAIEQ